MWVQSLGGDDPLEEETATHPSLLAWRTPRTEEPGGLQSVGSQRVGHDSACRRSCEAGQLRALSMLKSFNNKREKFDSASSL